MAAPVAPPPQNSPQTPPPSGSGLVRQITLVAILAVLLGLLAIDYAVIKPKSEKAKENLDTLVDEKNRAGIKPGEEGAKRDRNEHLVTSNDIHKWMGWGPSRTENHGFHKLEFYNFWGAMPLPRHYICVVYQTGKDGAPDMYSSHHLNAKPEDQDLPKDPTKMKAPEVDPNKAAPPATRDGARPMIPGTEGDKPADPADKPAEEPSEKPAETTPEEKTPAAPTEEPKEPAKEESAKQESAKEEEAK